MKQCTKSALGILAAAFLLAGCCTGRHATQWEYKVARPRPHNPNTQTDVPQSFLNDLAKDGWIFVQTDANGLYIFKRTKSRMRVVPATI